MPKVKIKINDVEYEVEQGLSVLDAAESVGIEIPHFCAHKYLKPAGLCRMCLVEIKGARKLQTSCTTPVKEGMEVYTESEAVVKARKEILELHLANHPLDCPECDQAGDCLLQKYYDKYGLYERRFDIERTHFEKDIIISDNLILDRERCILCQRCVRFSEEILGEKLLAVFERGSRSYIATYNDEKISTLYSGNFAEICPVGAITDRRFRFKIRNWFLIKKESICPLCERGCNIYVETPKDRPYLRNYERLQRISSRDNPEINKSFICDRGRYDLFSLEENRIFKGIYEMEEVGWQKIKKVLKEHLFTIETVILSSWMTNEEIDLALSLFKDYLNLKNIYFWGNPAGDEDEILIKKDKNPNSYYLEHKKVKRLNSKSRIDFKGSTLIFGDFFRENEFVLKKIEDESFVILISPYIPSFPEKINLLIPSANFFEKEGSYTNFEGRVQKVERIFENDKVKTEYEILKMIESILRKK